METRAHRIKLKPDTLGRVRDRAGKITRRQAEALETLRDEGVVLECFFLAHAEDGDSLISVMTATNDDHGEFRRDRYEVVQELPPLGANADPDRDCRAERFG